MDLNCLGNSNHHFVLVSENKEVAEIHTACADDFKEKRLHRYLEKLQKESDQYCQLVEWQGLKFYSYETAWQGFYLMIHMLRHFVGSGFGLRNLCDWVVLWENLDTVTQSVCRYEWWLIDGVYPEISPSDAYSFSKCGENYILLAISMDCNINSFFEKQ